MKMHSSERYRCSLCGAQLDEIPADSLVRIAFVSGSDRKTECVLTFDGEEVHRCAPRLAAPIDE